MQQLPVWMLQDVSTWHMISFGIFLLFAFVILRRCFLSPISDLPGPFLARFSILWQLWVTLKGRVGPATVDLHRKHGKFVRIGYNEVSISDPDAIKKVLRSNMDKASWYDIMAIPDSRFPNQMSERSAKRHIHKQKNLAAGYTLSNIIQSEPYIDKLLELFQSRLDVLAGKNSTVRFEHWLNYLAFDIVGEVTFSKQFGFLEQGRDIGDAVKNQGILTLYLALLAYFPWAHNYLLANPLIEKFGLQPTMHILDTCNEAIKVRSANDKVRKDMLEQWLDQLRKYPERMAESEIFSAVVISVGAGADTISAALQAFIYYLLRDPDMLKQLQNELDTVELSSIPSFEETQKLPVLQACLKETLRFHGPIAVGLPRVSPGITVCGRYFPPGVTISVHPYAISNIPSVYGDDVEKFDPRRWLKDDRQARIMENHLIAFGAGYNQCPGQHLARIEMSKIAALLIRDYDIKQVEEGREWKCKYHFAAVPYDWPCRIKRRRDRGKKVT